jgi:hypothetical protein
VNIDLEYINNYFRNHWKPSLSVYGASAYKKIAEKINNDEYLLDVGCGENPFKSLVKNAYGIDPANDAADLQVSIEDFVPQRKYDVITCLGSINFGDETIIANQISKVVSCLKDQGRIYWRLNPGRTDHKSELCKKIPFFPWTFEKLQTFADLHGFKQINETVDQGENVVRLYAEWHRL